MNTDNLTTEEAQLIKYRTKFRSLLFGSLSIITMAIAAVFYQNEFSIMQTATVLTLDGVIVNDSFVLFLVFSAISILLLITGVIYSVMKRKITGILLLVAIIGTIASVCSKQEHKMKDTLSNLKVELRADVTATPKSDTKIEIEMKEDISTKNEIGIEVVEAKPEVSLRDRYLEATSTDTDTTIRKITTTSD